MRTWNEVAGSLEAGDYGKIAAAGGSEQRVYPWSVPATSTAIDETYAQEKRRQLNLAVNLSLLSPSAAFGFSRSSSGVGASSPRRAIPTSAHFPTPHTVSSKDSTTTASPT
jgi:hypothetical protein